MKFKFMSLVAASALFFACGTPSYTTTTGTAGTTDTTGTTSSTSTSSNAAYSTPSAIQTSFTTQYPTATNSIWAAYEATTATAVDWELNGWTALDANDHVVSFDMDNEKYYAWYDQDGIWVGSTYAVSDYAKLPATVNTMLKEKYSAYTITSVQREMWKDKMAYEVKLKKDDGKIKLLVDDQGNVLKEKLKD